MTRRGSGPLEGSHVEEGPVQTPPRTLDVEEKGHYDYEDRVPDVRLTVQNFVL